MRRSLLLCGAFLLVAPAVQAQFLSPGTTIPVVANLPGLAGTDWRSDVSVTNVGDDSTTVVLELFPELRDGGPTFVQPEPSQIDLEPGEQDVLTDVVFTEFGLRDVKGALRLYSNDGTPLVIDSRTWTPGAEGGGFGQRVSGLLIANQGWLGNLVHDAFYRTNIGIFWPWEGTGGQLTITVYDSDGDQAAEKTVQFSQAGLRQLSLGSLGISVLPSGWATITCSPQDLGWYAYASRVDQVTGDAVYQAAVGRFTDVQR